VLVATRTGERRAGALAAAEPLSTPAIVKIGDLALVGLGESSVRLS
jgi:hypothetical protein